MFILPPNCMVPRATLLTMSPVFPNFLYLIFLTPSAANENCNSNHEFARVTNGNPSNLGFGTQRQIYGYQDKLTLFEASDVPIDVRMEHSNTPASLGRVAEAESMMSKKWATTVEQLTLRRTRCRPSAFP